MATITFDERKTNERPGVRAVHRGAGMSAYKAREVLDLIRNKQVGEARTILQFCERSAADEIIKVLDSAVANAGNNNDIPPEELFVSACYADEGATMKRWRPRARGRATKIRKRTCHITVIVGRFTQTELDVRRARLAAKGQTTSSPSADRARRVARSRSGEGSKSGATEVSEEATDEVIEDSVDTGASTTEATNTEVVEAEATDTDVTETEEASSEESADGVEAEANDSEADSDEKDD